MSFMRILLIGVLFVLASRPASAAAPFRLFEIGVHRFTENPAGQGRIESGRLNALGQFTVDTSNPTSLALVPPTALGKILIFTEAWFAYGQLGAEATANFRRANNGAPVVVAGLLYYEAEAHPQAKRDVGAVINLSTRGQVAAGGTATLIGGFVIEGQPRRVLLRAIGPSLAQFGVTDAAENVGLTLWRESTVLRANGDWATQPDVAAIEQAAGQTGAFALNRTSKDAALLVELPPGLYSAGVSSENPGSGGSALLEIYIMP